MPSGSSTECMRVKGPGDRVQGYQKTFWREVAKRTDLGLGPERIRLFRTTPIGVECQLGTVEY